MRSDEAAAAVLLIIVIVIAVAFGFILATLIMAPAVF